MTLEWSQHPDAERELAASAEWYERREDGVGYELLRAAHAAVRSILDPSVQWGFYRGRRTDPQVYSRSIAGFPIDVIFLRTESAVFVIAYAPERRRPGYWAGRLDG